MLRRDVGELTEFVTFTETAVYYPEDDRYLVERGDRCAHYGVASPPGPSA